MMREQGTRLEAGCGSLQETHCSVLQSQTSTAVPQTGPTGVIKSGSEQQGSGFMPLSDLCTLLEQTNVV